MDGTHLNSEGQPCDCGQTPPQPGQFEDRQREVAAEVPQGLPDSGRGYALPESGQPKYHTSRDVIGRLLDVLDQLERIAGKGAEGLENLSLIISQRIHFVELLDRAAAMIDPDRPEGTANYEARLDWLAKWREVVGR
jgi:hypothetical protein